MNFNPELAEALTKDASKIKHIGTYRGVAIDETWSKQALLDVAKIATEELAKERRERYKFLGILCESE